MLGFAKRWRTGHKDLLWASTQLAHVARQDHVLGAEFTAALTTDDHAILLPGHPDIPDSDGHQVTTR
jgi:hypothetical protein